MEPRRAASALRAAARRAPIATVADDRLGGPVAHRREAGCSASVHSRPEAAASHVQNRSADELKAHAQYYLMSLQSRSPELARAPSPVIWTSEENAYFEAQLAVVDEGSPERFAAIAAGLPDKSEDDVRAWYEKLLGDLLEIERGARA